MALNEVRSVLRVSGGQGQEELNRVLAVVANRLDQLEGFRGTPTIRSKMDLKGNTIGNVGAATQTADAVIKSQLDDVNAAIRAAFESAYPVGALYLSTIATDPATLLGFGTWEAYAAGKVLIGQDTADTDFDVLGDTGGVKTVDLSHTHATPDHRHPLGTSLLPGVGVAVQIYDALGGAGVTDSMLSATQTVMNPFIVVKIWRRTA